MLIHDFFNKVPDIVPDADPLIILDIESSVCMAYNSKNTNNTRHIYRRVHFVRNGKNKKCKRLTGVK